MLFGLSLTGAVALLFVLRFLPPYWPVPFLTSPWFETSFLAVVLGLTVAVMVGETVWANTISFAVIIGLAGGCVVVTWAVGDLSWAKALFAVAGTMVTILSARRAGIDILPVLKVSVCAFCGATAANDNGTVLGLGAFGLLCGAWLVSENLFFFGQGHWVASLTSWGESLGESVIRTTEHVLLSPCVWLIAALGNRAPYRLPRFIDFSTDAFLLKRSSLEHEFVHRLLRDYFALRELMPRIASTDSRQRLETIRSLGYQGESALDVLAELVEHEDASVRAAAITGLGHISSPIATRCLKQHLDDPATEVRQALIPALLNQSGDEVDRFFHQMKPLGNGCEVDPLLDNLGQDEVAIQEFLLRLGASAVDPLLARLDSHKDGYAAREAAMRVLIQLVPDLEVARPLLPFLEHSDRHVQRIVALVVTRLGDDHEFGCVLRLVAHPESSIRMNVVSALVEVGDERSVAALLDLLENNPLVRATVAIELESLRSREAIHLLLGRLDHADSFVVPSIINALAATGDIRAAEPLKAKLTHHDADVRLAAASGLLRLGEGSGTAILRSFLTTESEELRRGAVRGLAFARDDIEKALLAHELSYFGKWGSLDLPEGKRYVRDWLDPKVQITRKRIAKRAQEVGLSEQEVRSRYEALASDFSLRLEP